MTKISLFSYDIIFETVTYWIERLVMADVTHCREKKRNGAGFNPRAEKQPWQGLNSVKA